MNQIIDINARRTKLATKLKIGAGIGAAAVVAPITFLAIGGIIGATIAAALGVVIVNMAPVFSMKIANLKIKAITHEASQNPSETLDNALIDKKNRLQAAETELKVRLGKADLFIQEAEKFAQAEPTEAKKWLEKIQNTKLLRERRKDEFRIASEKVEAFERLVERAKVELSLAQMESDSNQALNIIDGNPLDNLKESTALKSIQLQVNTALASLEVSLLKDGELKDITPEPAAQLAAPDANVLEQVLTEQGQPVRRPE